MTVNSYLQGRANNLVIRETEKEKILKSVDTIKSRLSSYFSSDLSDALLFGSYTRGQSSLAQSTRTQTSTSWQYSRTTMGTNRKPSWINSRDLLNTGTRTALSLNRAPRSF